MTRKIKAQDVKPGMEIEYEHGDWTFSVVVGRCEESHGEVWVFSVAGVGRFLENGQKVTVLKESQPDEPTAFGACVKAGEVRFFRINTRGALRPWLSDGGGSRSWNELLSFGPVVIMCADPFATPEVPDKAEPRMWDRWEDVPDMVVVRAKSGGVSVRRNGDCVYRLFSDGDWARSILTARDLNFLAPFTEVRDA